MIFCFIHTSYMSNL